MFWIPSALAETLTGEITETVETATGVVAEAVNMNISAGDSLLYALIGFIVVFVALLIIIAAIKLTSAFVGRKSEKPAEKAEKKEAPAPAKPEAVKASKAALAPGSCGEMKLYNVSDKEAAMIMAIIADETKTPLNELRFLSIKQIG